MLVKIGAVSVNYGDTVARDFNHFLPQDLNMHFLIWLMARIAFGLNAPRNRVLDSEFAGEVASVGKPAKHFKVGQSAFG